MSRAALLAVVLFGCADQPPNSTPVALASDAHHRIIQARPGELVEPAPTPTISALRLVDRLAPRWGIAQLSDLEPRGEVAVGGNTLVRLEQQVAGIPVEAGELHLLVRPTGELVAASGVPASADLARDEVTAFTGTEAEAVARAVTATHPRAHALAGAGRTRARRVWHRTGDHLTAAWLVEAYLDDGDAVRTVIAATDGRVLAHRSLVDHDGAPAPTPFQYRVWADTSPELHPHDSPNADFVPYPHATPEGDYPARIDSSLVTVAGNNHPAGSQTPDPWLPAGATETTGNNIDAYTDEHDPDGFSAGDFRASVTSPGVFDRSYDFAQGPLASPAQQMASITALFFTLNWMHDFWYDMGLVETAGNAQASNYGRGGVEGDVLLAEAQDAALDNQRNNANMATPDDGMSPRMQVYVWTGSDNHSLVIAGASHETVSAAFGPTTFALTGDLVAATDSGGGSTTDGCEPFTTNVAGKIALVDRGTCSFKTKALNAQTAHAVGLVIADNQDASVPPSLGDDTTITTDITIGTMSVTRADGAALRQTLATAAGATSTTMSRRLDPDLDGSLDATVIAHEHGHYLHHRLSQCNTTMCAAMSEGWADFSALMMTARAGDDFAHGAFPLAQYATASFADPAYFGIRRVPYSADRAFDPLHYIDMADGVTLPATAPIASSGSSNSEAHNAGEIWATMLWDIYAAMQAEVGDFTAARTRMAKDVVAGLLLAPPDATPTEMRDALIAAAGAANPGDDLLFATAFAARGLGSCALSPDRDSTDFIGIVESGDLEGNAVAEAATVGGTACEADKTIDTGGSATIGVPLANIGFYAVDGVTVTVTSPTPGVTIDNATQDLGTLARGEHRDLSLTVHYAGGAGSAAGQPAAGELDLAIAATDGCTTNVVQKVALRLDVDDTLAGETDDHFDTEQSAWVADSNLVWQHAFPTALDGAWHGADLGKAAEGTLASPPLVVAKNQDFTVQFTHRYQFEFSDSTAWDGAVIEVSTDNGTTWADVSTLADPGYGSAKIGDQAGNPLAGRGGYTNQNAAYPQTEQVTLAFGRKLAGKTVRLRFVVGSDQAQGAGGWDIDDFLVTGILNQPFGAELPSTGTCGAGTDVTMTEDDGGCCSASPLRGSSAALAGLVGLIALRRRRRY